MSVGAAFQQLRDANPVPEPHALREDRLDAAAFRARTRQRSLTIPTRDLVRAIEPPQPVRPPRRRRAAAFAGGLAVVLLAALYVGTGPEPLETVAGDGVLTVDVLTDLDLSPFTDATGDPVTGFDIDVLTEMARRSGLTLTTSESLSVFSAQPQAHLFLVEFGTVDVTTRGYRSDIYDYAEAINISGDRLERRARFTDPYYREDLALVVDPNQRPDLRSVADLRSGDVVAAWGDANASFWIDDQLVPGGIVPAYVFEAGPRRPGSGSDETPLDAIAAGEAAAAIVHVAIVDELLEGQPGLSVVSVIDADIPLGFAVDPNNPALLMALNEALRSMIEDGTYTRIYDRWFEDRGGSVVDRS